MSRIPYRGGPPDDYGYAGRGDNRWDGDRFASERGGPRSRFDSIDSGRGGAVYEERDSRVTTRGGGGRPRERSIDELYERRGPGIGDDRYERRHYHDDDGGRYDSPIIPQRERERDPFDRRNGNVTIERDEYRPQRRTPRPGFLRRQSSLDTFDRKPLTRYVEREEYGPPARFREERLVASGPIPLPRTRQLGPPPGQYREEVREEYYDEGFAPAPERVREREVVRRRRRSRDSMRSHSRHGGSVRSHSRHGGSVRSDSIGSSSSSDRGTVRSEFPKRGKTRMPARLVSKKAIIDLNYPFEEEGDTIVIMRALGRENIDEIIKLSEDYNSRSAGSTTIIEERQEIISIPPPAPTVIAAPPPPPPVIIAAPPPPPPVQEIITDTKVVEHFDHGHQHHHHGSGAPIIVNAPHPSSHYGGSHHDHVTEIREVTHIDDRMALAPISSASRSEAAIRAEIRALELEKESLRRDRRRRGKSVGHADLVVYDEQRFHNADEDITVIRKEKIIEPDGGVRIEKDRKGRLAISVPKYIR